ncbi:unnamed protein product [Choristocarpus tenellus]
MKFDLAWSANVSAVEVKFPANFVYIFDLLLDDGVVELKGIRSLGGESMLESFDISGYCKAVSVRARGASGHGTYFELLDLKVRGVRTNPNNEYYVATTKISDWGTEFPHFVGTGFRDQLVIMKAVCAVKGTRYDGKICAGGGDEDSVGTVYLASGEYFITGPVILQSGVTLQGRYNTTTTSAKYISSLTLEHDGERLAELAKPLKNGTQVTETKVLIGQDQHTSRRTEQMLVLSDARGSEVIDVWLEGSRRKGASGRRVDVDPEGSACVTVTNSKDVKFVGVEARDCNGCGVDIRRSDDVIFDAFNGGGTNKRGIGTIQGNERVGVLVKDSTNVTFRDYSVFGNKVGIHVSGSTGVVFKADRGSGSSARKKRRKSRQENSPSQDDDKYVLQVRDSGDDITESTRTTMGSSTDPQLIDVVLDGSGGVSFKDIIFEGEADPSVMVDAYSADVKFKRCAFMGSRACVVEAASSTSVIGSGLVSTGNCFHAQ